MNEDFSERLERFAGGPRVQVVRALVGTAELGTGGSRALAMLLVDAVLDGDETTLGAAHEALQRLYADLRGDSTRPQELGVVMALLNVAAWGIERSVSLSALTAFESGTHAHQMLKAIFEQAGRSNDELSDALGVSNSEVSRVGRRLIELGVAVPRRVGRTNHWDITPRGVRMLQALDQGGVSRHQRPLYELQ